MTVHKSTKQVNARGSSIHARHVGRSRMTWVEMMTWRRKIKLYTALKLFLLCCLVDILRHRSIAQLRRGRSMEDAYVVSGSVCLAAARAPLEQSDAAHLTRQQGVAGVSTSSIQPYSVGIHRVERRSNICLVWRGPGGGAVLWLGECRVTQQRRSPIAIPGFSRLGQVA